MCFFTYFNFSISFIIYSIFRRHFPELGVAMEQAEREKAAVRASRASTKPAQARPAAAGSIKKAAAVKVPLGQLQQQALAGVAGSGAAAAAGAATAARAAAGEGSSKRRRPVSRIFHVVDAEFRGSSV